MFRRAKTTTTAMAPPASNGEVRVQKVEKIELVRNLVTRPSVYYGNPMAASATTMRRAAADHGAAAAAGRITASRPGVASVEDINKRSEIYIRERKRLFLGQT